MTRTLQWTVSQIGARQHYATPRALERRGELRTFYTEAWAGERWRPLLNRLGTRGRAFSGRFSSDLPPEKVVSFTGAALLELFTRRLRVPDRSIEQAYREFIRQGEHHCGRVNRHLRRHPLSPETDLFYGCMSVSLETLKYLGDFGIFSVVDQFDPARVEQDLVRIEREKWPDWESAAGNIPEEYFDRCAQEWSSASAVVVYSEWTRQAIVQQGVAQEKVMVVPLAYELPAGQVPVGEFVAGRPRKIRDRSEALTILWLGTVMLRKGIAYLLEAARQLQDRNLRFVVAGELLINDRVVVTAPKNVSFVGRVVRGQAQMLYRDADLFVIPTISDSFAITQVEAMAHGVPVIATDRCGQVVTDGADGKLISCGDAAELAAAIAALDDDRALLAEMSKNALIKARDFSLERYGEKLNAEVSRRWKPVTDASQ